MLDQRLLFQIINDSIINAVQDEWGVRRDNELNVRKYGRQQIKDLLLQLQMQMRFYFIDKYDSWQVILESAIAVMLHAQDQVDDDIQYGRISA